MALYNPPPRTIIASAHVRAVYGLFKGVAGLEDNILYSNNIAYAWTIRAKSPDPATDSVFMAIQNATAQDMWRQTWQGNQYTRNVNPWVRFKDLGTSGKDIRFLHVSGTYRIQENTAAEETPTWVDRFAIDLTTGTVTTGTFIVGDGTITTAKLANGAVTNPKLATNAVSPDKVQGGTYNINITGTAASATGANPTGPAGGGLTGTYPNPTIAVGAVGAAQILDGAVTGPKLGVVTPVSFGATFSINNGGLSIGGSTPTWGINVQPLLTSNFNEAFGILTQPTFQASPTTNAYVGFFRAVSGPSFVAINMYSVFAGTPILGAGNSITNAYGVYVASQDVPGIIGSTGVHVAAGNDIGIDVLGSGIRVVGGVEIVSGSLGLGGDTFITRSTFATISIGDSLVANGSIRAGTFMQVGTNPPSDGSIRMDYDSYIRWHNNASGNGGAIGETGLNTMFYASTATGAGTFAHRWDTGTGGPSGVIIYGDGGFVVGSPSGASKGPGTINAQQVWKNGTLLDKVFEPDYVRLSISDMKAYYTEHKYLPTLRSIDFHEEGSTELGGLTDRLWETVEVQAIYIAELEERISILEAK
jgi:hypothetical protein